MGILQFLGNDICPEGESSASIYSQDIVLQLWQRKANLACLLQVLDT